ncbi:MAG TPA: hypothetical protein VIH26_01395 [Anaerolineales bacterium]
MKLRVGDPWMSSKAYSKTLKSLSVNLLVAQIEGALAFQREVLGVRVVYSDPDFAVCSGFGTEWMLHADHTYDKHAMGRTVTPGTPRGSGVELRLHGCDPDKSEEAARRLGYEVLVPATDKGHGVREVYLRDADGYIWVPDVVI